MGRNMRRAGASVEPGDFPSIRHPMSKTMTEWASGSASAGTAGNGEKRASVRPIDDLELHAGFVENTTDEMFRIAGHATGFGRDEAARAALRDYGIFSRQIRKAGRSYARWPDHSGQRNWPAPRRGARCARRHRRPESRRATVRRSGGGNCWFRDQARRKPPPAAAVDAGPNAGVKRAPSCRQRLLSNATGSRDSSFVPTAPPSTAKVTSSRANPAPITGEFFNLAERVTAQAELCQALCIVRCKQALPIRSQAATFCGTASVERATGAAAGP